MRIIIALLSLILLASLVQAQATDFKIDTSYFYEAPPPADKQWAGVDTIWYVFEKKTYTSGRVSEDRYPIGTDADFKNFLKVSTEQFTRQVAIAQTIARQSAIHIAAAKRNNDIYKQYFPDEPDLFEQRAEAEKELFTGKFLLTLDGGKTVEEGQITRANKGFNLRVKKTNYQLDIVDESYVILSVAGKEVGLTKIPDQGTEWVSKDGLVIIGKAKEPNVAPQGGRN